MNLIDTSQLHSRNLLTCPSCSKLIKDPVWLCCGHVFCRKCIGSVGVGHEIMCAECGRECFEGVALPGIKVKIPSNFLLSPYTISAHSRFVCISIIGLMFMIHRMII
ncbi:hypothetical protein D917_05856 [Trichinella nativa]|uniref:RING-type domain-containing protein n=1 Tax=Trichinella nativa TaxID=6335 RepID=A0A1Y3EZT5_9BILA|nr:hypothetical protein D917_05856 [Trichinella nativa]